MSEKKELIVIALGGNALVDADSSGSYEDHLRNIETTCRTLLPLFRMDYDIVLTHGNGPQVGNILIQNEEASAKVPSMPLDVCVAESQGEIGFMLQQTLKNQLTIANIKKEVITLVTQVLVDKKDPAFEKPSKPIGPFYDQKQALHFIKEKKWTMAEVHGKGSVTLVKSPSGKKFRRVVPSPRPLAVLETRIIHQLLFLNHVPIAAGGGGIPVCRDKKGKYAGVEAVIDKDLASARLAIDLKADKFVILTNVDYCYLNFKKKSQAVLHEMNLDESITYLEQGQFSSGSMGPKVQAAIDYLTYGGREAYITSIGKVLAAIEKRSGTFIHH
jgi:carbamate kinase